MQPSQVRRQILDDHDKLRGMLSSLEALARAVLAGNRDQAGALRAEGEALHERLLEHMHWEDLYLVPALREADAWGEARAAEVERDHREQRELLGHTLAGLRDQSRPLAALADSLIDLVALLREDMEQEEQASVDARVLRDDVVGIDVEAG